MTLDQALISKLENLARLKLTDNEKAHLLTELSAMIDMFTKIGEVNTHDSEPLIHMTDNVNVMRADVEEYYLNTDEFLQNAPEHSDNYFKVPKVIE